jgi:hypothetical protein
MGIAVIPDNTEPDSMAEWKKSATHLMGQAQLFSLAGMDTDKMKAVWEAAKVIHTIATEIQQSKPKAE